MRVAIRTFGNLRQFLPEHAQGAPLIVPDNVPISQLLAQLGIPENEAWRVSRNGILVQLDDVLSEGDEVNVFAPVGGG